MEDIYIDKNKNNSFNSKNENIYRDADHRLAKAEVETLGIIPHKNVYEYMPNGNLFEALHSHNDMDWASCHPIPLGGAHPLIYLHHDLSPAIFHKDVKCSNILLDQFYEAKITDFGVAKVLQACNRAGDSTIVFAGTHGYISPEYAYSLKVTEKSVVYNFGVVLLELITSRQPIEPEFGEKKNIVSWTSRKILKMEDLIAILDSKISKSFKDQMIHVLKIAVPCTHKLPAFRPSMREIVQMLLDGDPCTLQVKFKS